MIVGIIMGAAWLHLRRATSPEGLVICGNATHELVGAAGLEPATNGL